MSEFSRPVIIERPIHSFSKHIKVVHALLKCFDELEENGVRKPYLFIEDGWCLVIFWLLDILFK